LCWWSGDCGVVGSPILAGRVRRGINTGNALQTHGSYDLLSTGRRELKSLALFNRVEALPIVDLWLIND
jgi:hypothetical protein